MAKKMTENQQRAMFADTVAMLKQTRTADVTFKAAGKTWTIAGTKINRGLVKDLKLGEAEIANLYDNLFNRQIAKVEGLDEVLDEMDWEDYDKLFQEWFQPVNDGGAELEKKYS